MAKFKFLSNPVFLIVLIMGSMLSFIGAYHNYAHYTMDKDADAYVYKWCKKNPDICTHRGNGY